jgi:hypothetical protein
VTEKKKGESVLVEQIAPRILSIRGQRVMVDADLARLYGVTTKRLNEQVKRNLDRFPADFMFQLTADEAEAMRSQFATAGLRSQIATSSVPYSLMRSQTVTASKRNVRYLPYAFTEHGALMAASVLNTPRAIDVSVYVIRAFVTVRELLATHKELSRKLEELERKVGAHDEAIRTLVAAIRQLMEPPPGPERPRIGFHVKPQGEP